VIGLGLYPWELRSVLRSGRELSFFLRKEEKMKILLTLKATSLSNDNISNQM
jgi:hypothetical protein